ncbi:MAG TPA: Crp/Fnr family transcriptional regulator [Verrucomicrobiales bacterium]|nr:Crp/Fnr family transcriptional regulator [Verrucomicrobiales bacterium]
MPTGMLSACPDLPEALFDSGAAVLEEGGRSGKLFILKSGSVEIVKESVSLNEIDQPGAVFGEISHLLDQSHMATVRTLEPSCFYVVEDPEKFFVDNPAFAREVARLLARRLQGVTRYLVDLKRQFDRESSHLSMVDEVLEALISQSG